MSVLFSSVCIYCSSLCCLSFSFCICFLVVEEAFFFFFAFLFWIVWRVWFDKNVRFSRNAVPAFVKCQMASNYKLNMEIPFILCVLAKYFRYLNKVNKPFFVKNFSAPPSRPDCETNSKERLKLFLLWLALITESCKTDCAVSPFSYMLLIQGDVRLSHFWILASFSELKKIF